MVREYGPERNLVVESLLGILVVQTEVVIA
jgi:hypothetical protein